MSIAESPAFLLRFKNDQLHGNHVSIPPPPEEEQHGGADETLNHVPLTSTSSTL